MNEQYIVDSLNVIYQKLDQLEKGIARLSSKLDSSEAKINALEAKANSNSNDISNANASLLSISHEVSLVRNTQKYQTTCLTNLDTKIGELSAQLKEDIKQDLNSSVFKELSETFKQVVLGQLSNLNATMQSTITKIVDDFFKKESNSLASIEFNLDRNLQKLMLYLSTFDDIKALKKVCSDTCSWFRKAYKIPMDITAKCHELTLLISHLDQSKILASSAVAQASALNSGIITLLSKMSQGQEKMGQLSDQLLDYVAIIDKYGDNFLQWQKVIVQNASVVPSEHLARIADVILNGINTAINLKQSNKTGDSDVIL